MGRGNARSKKGSDKGAEGRGKAVEGRWKGEERQWKGQTKAVKGPRKAADLGAVDAGGSDREDAGLRMTAGTGAVLATTAVEAHKGKGTALAAEAVEARGKGAACCGGSGACSGACSRNTQKGGVLAAEATWSMQSVEHAVEAHRKAVSFHRVIEPSQPAAGAGAAGAATGRLHRQGQRRAAAVHSSRPSITCIEGYVNPYRIPPVV